jgi:F-box-like
MRISPFATMAHKIPDEILKEILSLALKIDDDTFADTSFRSPFSSLTQSKSVFLTVCKRWLRVSTPLLYNVVVLRSAAQARALARVLKKNKEFGRFIKKIRIEGGFGAAMEKILSAAHNTTDVHILLEIWSNDNVSGLCKGLPLLNPLHVILWRGYNECSNSQVRWLYKTLGECMKTWKNMARRLCNICFPVVHAYS